MRVNHTCHCLLAALLLALTATGVQAASDFQWTFGDDGGDNYLINAVSSKTLYDGALGVGDPTINLIVGRRYGVTVSDFTGHPLQLLAKGAGSGSDVVLLAQGVAAGTLEGDTGINWVDSGGALVEFTLTPALAAAMAPGGGRNPGYRCEIHSDMMRGNFTIYGLGTAIANPIAETIPKGPYAVELQTVMSGLVSPLTVTEPDDGSGRLFIVDQVGRVHVISGGTPSVFLDVSARLVTLSATYDERGLLGFAMHPNFTANPKVYTYTSEPVAGAADFTTPLASGSFNHQSVIAEWTVSGGNPNAIDPATRREILRIDQPQGNHNAGSLQFGNDGLLTIALGDGGAGDDQGNGHGVEGNAQNVDNVYGSILRINVDLRTSANGQYGVPATNPFVGAAGVDEIWAYGFRNPYATSVDRATGALYVGDAGQNKIEEVSVVTAAGQNFGWNVKEGSFYFDPNGTDPGFVTTLPARPVPAGLVDPIAQYDHDDGIVVVGGAVWRAGLLAGFDGTYIFGDYALAFGSPAGRLFYLGDGNQVRELIIGNDDRALGLYLKGFGQDQAGNVYVCGSTNGGPSGTNGIVQRIVPLAVPVELSTFSVN